MNILDLFYCISLVFSCYVFITISYHNPGLFAENIDVTDIASVINAVFKHFFNVFFLFILLPPSYIITFFFIMYIPTPTIVITVNINVV